MRWSELIAIERSLDTVQLKLCSPNRFCANTHFSAHIFKSKLAPLNKKYFDILFWLLENRVIVKWPAPRIREYNYKKNSWEQRFF